MSMYNIIFGTHAEADVLLAIIGRTREDFGRFRDAYVAEEGGEPVIAVYTRNGGGNRDCWCEYDPKYGTARCKHHEQQEEVDETVTLTPEEIEAKGYEPINVFVGGKRMAKTGRRIMKTRHVCEEPSSEACWCVGCFTTYQAGKLPGYVRDEDDDFDSTYCTFYFRPPDDDWWDLLAGLVREGTPDASWVDFLGALRDKPSDPKTRPQKLAVDMLAELRKRA